METLNNHWYIYIMSCDYMPGVYKIGFTKDPFKRIIQVNGQHPTRPINYLNLFHKWGIDCDTVKRDEKDLHRDLKDCKYFNEWFKLNEYNIDWAKRSLKAWGYRDVLNMPYYKKLAA